MVRLRKTRLIAILVLGTAAHGARGGEVEITAARAECGAGRCAFHVALRHADTGWDHYADLWRVLAPDGTELGRRVLYHPHVDEQPFTRSQTLAVPRDLDHVLIEAHDKVHGYTRQRFRLNLPERR